MTAATICSRSFSEIGGSIFTGLIFAAGVMATGIRGALGTSAAAANEASASEPRGVFNFTLVTEVVADGRVVLFAVKGGGVLLMA